MIWIKTEEEVMTVTKYYLHTIGQAFELLNQPVEYKSNIKDIKPNPGDIVVLCTAPNVVSLKKKNIKIVFWTQGAWPEESLMRNSSKLRFRITSAVEKVALKKSDFVFFVSDHMRNHYTKKYKLLFENYYTMPCLNDSFHEDSFMASDKYKNNIFCYAGGTSVWQCFEDTIALYSKIENTLSNCKLLLLVKDREYAERIIHKYHVKNYEIDYVSVEELPNKLKDVKYGFLLRRPSIVNEVATPTKTLTYISNGVIPIYSQCLNGINEILNECSYKIVLQEGMEKESILTIKDTNVDNKDIYDEYLKTYNKFYDAESHVKKIAKSFIESGIITE